MKQNPLIYMRGLKHVAFTVFCVENGQKYYYDPQFKVRVPYSSGQQVKRSIMDKICEVLNVKLSPTIFCFEIVKDKNKKGMIRQKELLSSCDPYYIDQLLGGWMRAVTGGEEKTVKRRSPFGISAMTALHPLLAGLPSENISYDRSNDPSIHKVKVRGLDNQELTDDQIAAFLNGDDKGARSFFRSWIPNNNRATGLFTYDIVIDLRRLFCVSTNRYEPEITSEMVEKLKNNGWKVINNTFGECLLMPEEQRKKVIPAIAEALIDWHITSNQSRTFDLMETLAIAISDNANTLATAIRAKLVDGNEDKPKAKPIVDDVDGAKTYITLAGAGHIITNLEDKDALKKAKKDLIDRMLAFDYENQM